MHGQRDGGFARQGGRYIDSGARAKIEKIERQRGTRWWDRAIATLAFFFLQGRTGWKKVMASEIAKLGMPEDKLS